MAYLKKSRKNYYGIYKGQGNKTRCISLKTQSLSLAKQRLRAVNKLEYEIKLGITEDPLADKASLSGNTLSAMVSLFLKSQENLIQKSTLQRYKDALNELIRIFGKDKPIDSFVKSDNAILMKGLLHAERVNPKSGKIETRFTPTTVNILLRGIRRFFNWAVEEEYIDKLPFRIKLLKIDKSHPKFMTDDEVKQLMKAAEDKPLMRDVFLIHLNTGMRVSELKNSELLPDGEHLRITNTKGRQDRIIPIDPELVDTYLKVKENVPHKCTVSHQFKVFAQKAGLSNDITFHSLRHTFAVRHWIKHRDINLTKQVLGHSSVVVTEIYTKIPIDYLKNVINIRNNHH
ncbi:MAG: tyrosine-type recombinase/integrase [Candidatus Marinimicrobia bacterium]|nr:tyrosine-type recombinase/integrase [Candidatus Neomarinimicrobiota bacterium]